jgi:hypothetical protein
MSAAWLHSVLTGGGALGGLEAQLARHCCNPVGVGPERAPAADLTQLIECVETTRYCLLKMCPQNHISVSRSDLFFSLYCTIFYSFIMNCLMLHFERPQCRHGGSMKRGGACRRGRPEETVYWRRRAQHRRARVNSHVHELEIRSELPDVIPFLYDYSL